MNAVIYARYSSDNQREESIEGQIRECTAFAEKNGITILKHYIDRAYSAKTDNRPEFQRMINDSRQRLFDIVLVWKLDRFARNRYDSANYKNILKKNGVRVVSANEPISDRSEGILLESMLEGFAEYFSADLAEKVSRGMTENALKCKFNGGNPTIGFTSDKEQNILIDPVKAPFVLDAFKMYDDGATMSQIRDFLNENNVLNSRGNPHTVNSVAKILKNRRYIGEYSYRDIVIPNGIPAIVPQDLFDRVQEKIEKNKKAPARAKAEVDYLLTTKLFCGHCGAYMCGESGKGRSGKVYHYYKCVSVKKKRTDCKKKAIKKDFIEEVVIRHTMKTLNDDAAIEAIISMLMDLQERENVNLPLYEQQLRDVERNIENLLNAIQQGILTKSTKARMEELEAAKEELEIRIANERIAKPKLTEEHLLHFLHKFRVLDMSKQSHRQRLIDTFVNRIYLYDDKLVITFNHKDGAETITLNDIEAALADAENGSDLVSFAVPKTQIPIWVSAFLHFIEEGTRTIKYKAPGEPFLPPAGRRQLHNLTSPFRCIAFCWTATIPQSASLTAPSTQGSLFTVVQHRTIPPELSVVNKCVHLEIELNKIKTILIKRNSNSILFLEVNTMNKIISCCPCCGDKLHISALHCSGCGVEVKNYFELSKFDALSQEQYTLLLEFLKSRGSLKAVQNKLGISYPTAKKKVDELLSALDLLEDSDIDIPEEIDLKNYVSDRSSVKASEIIKAKLLDNGGRIIVHTARGLPCEIIAHSDGKSFVSKKLPIKPAYEYTVFDTIVDLLLANNGKARKGNGRSYKLGHPECDEKTVVGAIALNYRGQKIGDSVYDPVFVLAAVLEWAGIASNERGGLVLSQSYRNML